MKVNSTVSLIGGGFAFLLATACCWLPVLALSVGGAASVASLSAGFEDYSGLFMSAGVILLGVGGYQLYNNKKTNGITKLILSSTITCPHCDYKKDEEMPTNACQYFYECENCKAVIKPLEGDCCVYCSYGSVPCPPIQEGEACC